MPPITTISRMSTMMSKESVVSGLVWLDHSASRAPASAATAAAMQLAMVR
jgi:hypothetical protein